MFKSSNHKESNGGGSPKILTPGTHRCRIVDLKLDVPPYNKESYFIVLTLEGMDMGNGFEGIAVDKNNPTLGTYRGQIASVRSGRYPLSTYEYNGKTIQRDEQMFRWINNLAKQMGVLSAMNAAGVEGDTIEEYIANTRKFLVNPELWGNFTIMGQEYFTEGYDKPNYRMFFPKAEGKMFPFVVDSEKVEQNLIKFDAAKHIIPAKKEEPSESVTSFGGQSGKSDLSL